MKTANEVDRVPPELVAATIEEAHRAAYAVVQVDRRLRRMRPDDKTAGVTSLDHALMIGAVMRLRDLESQSLLEVPPIEGDGAGLRKYLALAGATSGLALAQFVLEIRMRRLAWARLARCRGDVSVDFSEQGHALQQLARFLWRHRHLAAQKEQP